MHIKDGYIEFRGPGGIYTNKDVSEITDTMLRFARAMTIAADPQAYRQEYQKKLYKTLSKSESGERTIDSLFADFQSGDINKEVFKKRWANLVVKQTQNQQVLNKLDDKPDDARTQKARQYKKILLVRQDDLGTLYHTKTIKAMKKALKELLLLPVLNLLCRPQLMIH